MNNALTIEVSGRRAYIVGNTYPFREALWNAGAKRDSDSGRWYFAGRSAAIAREAAEAFLARRPEPQQSQSQGEGTRVIGRASYKGRSYYVVARSRDATRTLLAFRDGSKTFWADSAQVQTTKLYRQATTIASLREYAERREAERSGEVECPVCTRHCTCGTGTYCLHHHDGCERCGAEG